MNPRKVVCFLAVILIACAPLTLAQGTYTQIDYPGAAQTFVEAVNSAGDVVGTYGNASGTKLHGFLLSGGIYTTIDYPGATYTVLVGINDVGQIVGSTGKVVVGFLYDVATQTFTTISYPGAAQTSPFAINNAGTIVGGFFDVSRNNGYGFELVGSRYRRIAPPDVARKDSSVNGISTSGKLIGSVDTKRHGLHANWFLFEHGKYEPIRIPNAPSAGLFGINPQGTALVGSYTPSTGILAGFVYQNRTLQTLQFPGSNTTGGNGINAAGEVVGSFYDASGPHGYTWTP